MANNSELITWSAQFACGIKIIDQQHIGLVKLVNNMFTHVSGNSKQEREYFEKIIQEMVNYVKIHFATEEKIMLTFKFPGYAAHKVEHEKFIFTVVENIRDFRDGKHLTLASFTRFLKDWILSHIAVNDKLYFEYFRKLAAARKAEGRQRVSYEDISA